MKINHFIFLVCLFTGSASCYAQQQFSFAFFTDIHLNYNKEAKSFDGFKQALKMAESNKDIDFILTGGDNVDVDGMKAGRRDTAAQLYRDYKTVTDQSRLKFYFTIGNHDRYWAEGKEAPLANDGLFRSFFGEAYYTFDHKGWRFIVLNSVETVGGKYCVSEKQKQWLADVLAKTPKDQPIIVSAHVPFLSLYYPVLEGRYTDTDTFANQKQVFDMFDGYNLKLVLQGHQHLYEEIKIKGVQFITAGAVSAGWWGGSFHGTEEGYLQVSVNGDHFSWNYVDYGWNAQKK